MLKSTSTDSRGAPRSETFSTIRPAFDDPNVVPDAGVIPALRLGESAHLYDLLEEALTVDSPNATAKTACVVGGMLADANSIDDLELLRHGGMGRLFGGILAPSTLGTFLRSFTHGHVQEQAAAYGYSGVRGLNIQLATVSTPLRPPVIARARLRKGNTSSAKGAGRLGLLHPRPAGRRRGRRRAGADDLPRFPRRDADGRMRGPR